MLYFLQSGITPLEARQNPYIYFGFIIAGACILFFFALNKVFQKKIFDLIRRSSSRKEINSVSDYFGFDKEERKFLFYLCKKYRIKNLAFCFKNDKEVDKLFKKIYHVMSEGKAYDSDIEVLFLLRQKIERYRRKSTSIASSQNIARNQELSLITSQKEQYLAVVLENTPQGLVITTPRDSLKNEVIFKPLSKIGIFFRSKNFMDYIFTSRIVRYSTLQNANTIVLMHSNNITALKNREFRRKDLSVEARMSYAIPQIDANVVKESIVQGSQVSYKISDGTFSGEIVDISAGGCCIKASRSVSVDLHVKIEIQHDLLKTEEIIGHVLHSKENKGVWTLHVQFKKMTKKARNIIFSLVYDYLK
ncbi:MAG: PilZ domain-containing protein [Treponemataceae bacterium]